MICEKIASSFNSLIVVDVTILVISYKSQENKTVDVANILIII